MKPAIHLMLDPDMSPLGYERERQVSDYPRRYNTIHAPVAFPHRVTLTLPARMSADEWAHMLAFLDVAREGIVEGNP